MKTDEIDRLFTPEQLRTIKEYARVQQMTVEWFIRMVVIKAVQPHEDQP